MNYSPIEVSAERILTNLSGGKGTFDLFLDLSFSIILRWFALVSSSKPPAGGSLLGKPPGATPAAILELLVSPFPYASSYAQITGQSGWISLSSPERRAKLAALSAASS